MDNKTVSTNYVGLQPPYNIIKHGNKIGLQIGIQRVTITSFNPLKTETHDYPVVAAENRITALKDNDYRVDGSCDGVVWDNVESKLVSVLCKTGVQLEWQQFITILWHDHARLGDPRQQINKLYIYKKIINYNRCMMLPLPGSYTIHLRTESLAGNMPSVVHSSEEDVFALNVAWTDNLEELENQLVSDLTEYLLILSPNHSTNLWHLKYATEEEQLVPLVERLNANSQATSFRHRIMSSFTITAVIPYEEKDILHSAQPVKEHGEHYYGKDISIFHPNLDEKKIAQTIMSLNRSKSDNKKIAHRNFCLILYHVFSSHPGCLTINNKTKFLDWIKFNCKIYFETHDLKKVELDNEEEQRVDIYHAEFADKQPNGNWYFKRQYYKTDVCGNTLQSIDGIS